MKQLNIQELKELENKINKEYEGTGKILIQKAYKDTINLANLTFVEKIMDIVKPLDIDTPIVVDRSYIIIDGYHRVKNGLLSGKLSIDAIVLDHYSINRVDDGFLKFVSSKVGKTITFIDEYIIKVGDKLYQILPNEGCGGCSNGWSSIQVKKGYINKEMLVKEIKTEDIDDDVYDLYINGSNVAKVDTGRGSGYYGGDFEIKYIV